MRVERLPEGLASRLGPRVSLLSRRAEALSGQADRAASTIFVLPAALVLLAFSLFPLFASLYVALSRLQFVKGGVELRFVGLANFRKLILGSQQDRFLGTFGRLDLVDGLILALLGAVFAWWLVSYVRREGSNVLGLGLRILAAGFLIGLTWLVVRTIGAGGRPGTMVTTLIYVVVGISVQYTLGLGLAWLTVQRLPGRRVFRVIFLIPMMITPVGVAYTFRMLTDTSQGPLAPLWRAVGLGGFAWVADPWWARAAILIGDTWQWTPFMFIVLLAALEGQSEETLEAATVDGASRWQIFRHITLPAIVPVSTTIILIRMIEAFKIIDLPNVLTNGGPGTSTESLTLHSYIIWRALDIGGSAAVGYMLLFVVTLTCIIYIGIARRRMAEGA